MLQEFWATALSTTTMFTDSDPGWLQLRFGGGTLCVGSDAPEQYVRTTEGTVDAIDDLSRETQVGTFSVFYVDIQAAMNDGVGYFDVLDSCSETAAYLELFDEKGDYSQATIAAAREDPCFESNLLILDRLTVRPEYRGHRVRLATLSTLMRHFSAGASIVAMKPFPLQFEAHSLYETENKSLALDAFPKNHRTATAKLCHYYSRLGFRKVKGTDLMVSCTSLRFPDASSLLSGKRKRKQLASQQR